MTKLSLTVLQPYLQKQLVFRDPLDWFVAMTTVLQPYLQKQLIFRDPLDWFDEVGVEGEGLG